MYNDKNTTHIEIAYGVMILVCGNFQSTKNFFVKTNKIVELQKCF